ncbi:MAG: DUF3105 domain-containing protein [Actinobacteria bacterium]|nr:DUF3105 domain-containing protein [Actinomycetota bacterium]
MARKDRVPNPPKRPQAPQRRHTATDPAVAARRRRNLLYALGAASLLALAIVLGAVFLSGSESSERQVLEDAGCTLQTFPALKGTHVANPDAKPKWNSSPPTSGPHSPTPAVWGSYNDPVELIQSVHNLEHGGVVIHYGPDVPEQTVTQIKDFYNEDPNGLIVAPLPSLKPKDAIMLSAWTAPERGAGADDGRGYLARCTKFDEKAFSKFVDEHRYKGPERVPAELLTPGS